MTRKRRQSAKGKYRDNSQVMRFSKDNYLTFTQLKTEYAAKNKLEKITFDEFLMQLFNVAQLLIRGKEVYFHNGKLYADLAEARGQAITDAIKNQTIPTMPQILLVVGEDNFLKNGEE